MPIIDQMPENANYYSLLDIPKTASLEDIKKAYKRLAVKWHPDRNGGSVEASEMFKLISKAYETLSDPRLRERYDNGDSDDECDNIDPFSTFASTFGDFFRSHGLGALGVDDFDDPEDVVVDCINYVEVDITDLWIGATVTQQYDRYSECEQCNGFGTKSKKLANCKKCKGAGNVPMSISPTMTVPVTCQSCNGSCIDKSVPKCEECKGAKFVPETVEVELDLKPGSFNGTKIIVEAEGNIIPPEEVKRYGKSRSDAVFIIREMPHPSFKRGLIVPGKSKLDFADLLVELNISFEESLIGFTKYVEHPSKVPIKICVSEYCRHGDTIVVKNQGMPDYDNCGRYGDLFVKIQVEKPTLTPEVKEKLSQALGYTHTKIKTGFKYMPLDEYIIKCEEDRKALLEKQKMNSKFSSKSKSFTHTSTYQQHNSQEKMPTKTNKNTSKPETLSKPLEQPKAKRGRPRKNPEPVHQKVIEYSTDEDEDENERIVQETAVLYNVHDKHKATLRPSYLDSDSDDDRVIDPKKIINVDTPFDDENFQRHFRSMENSMSMQAFRGFQGMHNMYGGGMYGMNGVTGFESDDESNFQKNGKGRYTSTVTHPDGHTTTTTTRTFVNGKEMNLEDLPSLNIDLSGIPELENIPGLQGLFGIGSKKKK